MIYLSIINIHKVNQVNQLVRDFFNPQIDVPTGTLQPRTGSLLAVAGAGDGQIVDELQEDGQVLAPSLMLYRCVCVCV